MKVTSILSLFFLVSCTTAKLPVPPSFSTQATPMPVKGLNGWQVNQQLRFGEFETSKIKRGWDFSSSYQRTKFKISPEEAILKVFNIDTDKNTNTQRNKFQYTIQNGTQVAEIYATENFRENQLVYKSNNPWIGKTSKTNRYEYAFAASIIPVSAENKEPWSLVLINKYDIQKDTARRLFDRPYVEEEGYATNGKNNIAIRPLRVDKVSTGNNKETKILGGNMLAGYELMRDNTTFGMIDILSNTVWMSKTIEPFDQLVVAAVSSAILLKRMQDVEKDRDQL